MPINIEELKRKHGQSSTSIPKETPSKPPLTDKPKTETLDDVFEDTKKEDPAVLEKKRELIKQLFDENKDLPIEEMLMYYFTEGDGKKMGKTVSPLKGIREGLEDMLNIQQLSELVKGFRNVNQKQPQKEEEEDMGDNSNLLTLLPFLQKMQNGGMDTSKLDPTMLLLAMGMSGQKQSNSNLGQLFLMMSMANMFAQQPQQQATASGSSTQPNPAINAEMIKTLYQELQNVMNQQQKPQIDPVTLMMINAINKSNQNQGTASNQNIEILLDKFNSMMQNNQQQQMAMLMQQSNDKFERGMEMIASALHREKPEEKILSNFQLFRELTGEKRERSRDEMDYDIKKREIELQEMARRDMLDREERQQVREEQKSSRIMETASTVLEKVIGNGLGNLVKDVMSVKGDTGKRRGRGSIEDTTDFDSSLLDNL